MALLDISFKDYCVLEGINASSLKYWMGEPFSPKSAAYNYQTPRKDTDAFRTGRAVHAWLEYRNRMPPEYELAQIESWGQKGGKALKKDIVDAGKIPLNLSEISAIENMSAALWNDPLMKRTHDGDILREVSIKVNGYKGMFDVVDVDDSNIIDWKTTRHSDPRKIESDAYKLGYHLQAYHYQMLAQEHFKKDFTFSFAFVCTAPPHETFIYLCSDDFMEAGKKAWDISVERLAKYGKLPYSSLDGLSTEVLDLEIPDWVEDSEEDLTLLGDFE